jgi:hypothetical protein
MNRNINESFVFLLAEYKRLKLKKEKIILTKDEEEALNKLKSFLGKEDE